MIVMVATTVAAASVGDDGWDPMLGGVPGLVAAAHRRRDGDCVMTRFEYRWTWCDRRTAVIVVVLVVLVDGRGRTAAAVEEG